MDDSDESLAHALAREVFEETGLVVNTVVEEMMPSFKYETVKTVGGREVRKSCVQVNFLVECDGDEVRVNPVEHLTSTWARREEIANLEMTDGMRGLVERAFELKR